MQLKAAAEWDRSRLFLQLHYAVMPHKTKLTLIDRVAFAFFGGLTGAAYGVLISLVLYFAAKTWYPDTIGWSAAVFGCLGFFFGNLIGEAFLALVHFVWGLIQGLSWEARPIEDGSAKGYLRAFMFIGFGTGLVLLISWH